MLRVFLNNNQCEYGVLGLGDLSRNLELRRDLHGYLLQMDGTVTFVESDYDYLRGLYDSGYCQDVDVDIQHSDLGDFWQTKAKMIIKLAGVSWDRIRRQAECPLVDNSFQSKIYNNRQIVFQLGSRTGEVFSKNGVDVSSKVVYHSNVQMFAPFRGRYFEDESVVNTLEDDVLDYRPPAKSGMFIYDALNLMLAMLTDDDVNFASTFFSYDITDLSTANDEAATMLFTGGQLKNGSTYPKLNFEQFFNDLHKLCNVWFGIEQGSDGKPVFRVEQESYFRQNNSNVYFNSVKELSESIDLAKIYSKVSLGCSQSSSSNFPIGEVPLVHNVQEEFPLSGTCNTSNELSLRLEKLIINTNSIAASLPSVSGFANGGSVKRKYTNEITTSAPDQFISDTNAEFLESLIAGGFLIENPRTGVWSYINQVVSGTIIQVFDEVVQVDNTGLTKDYEIYKPKDVSDLEDEVFLIQIDRATSDETIIYAKKTEIDPPANLFYYNETFANYKVIERHLGGIAQSIVNSLSDGNDEFEAGLTVNDNFADFVYFLPVPNEQYLRIRFDDDSTLPYFDTNDNYDTVTGIYTAPQGGYYSTYASIRFTNNSGHDFTQQVEIVKVTATGEVLESESTFTTIVDSSSHTFTLDRVFYLQEGQQIQVVVKKPFALDGIYLNQYVPWAEFDTGGFGFGYGVVGSTSLTFFGVDFLYNGGGLVPASTPNDVRLVSIEAEISLDTETFDDIIQNPYKYYHANVEGSTYITGYIEKISHSIETGETTITLFKKQNGV